MFSAATIAAEVPPPDGIELLDERVNERWIVGEDTVLEVALAHGLCTHPRTGEICRAKVRFHTIYDDALEMDTRT